MKWWICLTALVLALTTSAAAADLPAELERAADQVYRMIEDRIRRERRRMGL